MTDTPDIYGGIVIQSPSMMRTRVVWLFGKTFIRIDREHKMAVTGPPPDVNKLFWTAEELEALVARDGWEIVEQDA